METTDQVLVGEAGNHIYISVHGRGNFQNSQPMKKFALTLIDKGKADILVDLEKCVGMDSTFMGVLAGIAIKLKKSQKERLKLVHVTPHNLDLLETLGLIHLLKILDLPEEGAPILSPVEGSQGDKKEVAEHMLEAHETLSRLTELNKVKFKNVIQYLEEDIEKNKE